MFTNNSGLVIKFKIAGVDKDFWHKPFGQQMESLQKIKAFKEKAKKIHLSQKHQSWLKAIQTALKMYNIKEYYTQFNNSSICKDDSFEFWYTTNEGQ